ncbi:hypothetical protein N7513_003019 [Penicillium frequentans]|nr:hypothetical protein N7513_003019 [Penicillium glabrum]
MDRFYVQVTLADDEQVEDVPRISEVLDSLQGIIDGLSGMLEIDRLESLVQFGSLLSTKHRFRCAAYDGWLIKGGRDRKSIGESSVGYTERHIDTDENTEKAPSAASKGRIAAVA